MQERLQRGIVIRLISKFRIFSLEITGERQSYWYENDQLRGYDERMRRLSCALWCGLQRHGQSFKIRELILKNTHFLEEDLGAVLRIEFFMNLSSFRFE